MISILPVLPVDCLPAKIQTAIARPKLFASYCETTDKTPRKASLAFDSDGVLHLRASVAQLDFGYATATVIRLLRAMLELLFMQLRASRDAAYTD